MILLSWNGWGLANPKTKRQLYRHCLNTNPDFIILLEPMINKEKEIANFLKSFQMQFLATNESERADSQRHSRGNIWVLAKESLSFRSSILATTRQMIHIHIQFSQDISFSLTAVHADTKQSTRKKKPVARRRKGTQIKQGTMGFSRRLQ